MNPWVGWALAAAALYAGWRGYGWPGVALAFSVIVFWLLLQFNRSLRVLRNAGESPVGRVDSAVMLHAALQPRMSMLDIVKRTRSIGRRVSGDDSGKGPEVWAWADDGGSRVEITLVNGRCTQWVLHRPSDAGASDAAVGEPAAPMGVAASDNTLRP
jgi:hypothetical protein